MPEGVQGTPWVQYSKQTTSGTFQIRSDCSSTSGMEVQQVLEVAGAGCGMVRRFSRTQTERNEKKISAQSYSHTVTQSDKMNEYSKVGYPLQCVGSNEGSEVSGCVRLTYMQRAV